MPRSSLLWIPLLLVGTLTFLVIALVGGAASRAHRELRTQRNRVWDAFEYSPAPTAILSIDGRITIMFCNFDRPALILRIYGRGRAVLPQDAEWDALAAHFTILPGTRQIFVIDVESVQTSCGWGVPFMALERERDTLQKAHLQMEPDAWVARAKGRTRSIDGIETRPTDRYFGPTT